MITKKKNPLMKNVKEPEKVKLLDTNKNKQSQSPDDKLREARKDPKTTDKYMQVSKGVYDKMVKDGIDKNYNLKVFDADKPTGDKEEFETVGTYARGTEQEQSLPTKEDLTTVQNQDNGLNLPTKETLTTVQNQDNGLNDRKMPFNELPIYQQVLASVAVGTGGTSTTQNIGANIADGGITKALGTAAGMSKTGIARFTAKTVITGELAASMMTAWLGSDNYVFAVTGKIASIINSVKWDGADPNKAYEKIQKAKQKMQFAKKTVNTATITNPFLWRVKPIWIDNIETSLIGLQEEEDRLRLYASDLPTTEQYQEQIQQQQLMAEREAVSDQAL